VRGACACSGSDRSLYYSSQRAPRSFDLILGACARAAARMAAAIACPGAPARETLRARVVVTGRVGEAAGRPWDPQTPRVRREASEHRCGPAIWSMSRRSGPQGRSYAPLRFGQRHRLAPRHRLCWVCRQRVRSALHRHHAGRLRPRSPPSRHRGSPRPQPGAAGARAHTSLRSPSTPHLCTGGLKLAACARRARGGRRPGPAGTPGRRGRPPQLRRG